MKTACFIPIKQNSERVPGKNFRPVGGVPLYQAIVTIDWLVSTGRAELLPRAENSVVPFRPACAA